MEPPQSKHVQKRLQQKTPLFACFGSSPALRILRARQETGVDASQPRRSALRTRVQDLNKGLLPRTAATPAPSLGKKKPATHCLSGARIKLRPLVRNPVILGVNECNLAHYANAKPGYLRGGRNSFDPNKARSFNGEFPMEPREEKADVEIVVPHSTASNKKFFGGAPAGTRKKRKTATKVRPAAGMLLHVARLVGRMQKIAF